MQIELDTVEHTYVYSKHASGRNPNLTFEIVCGGVMLTQKSTLSH